jgi:hypothetical protein
MIEHHDAILYGFKPKSPQRSIQSGSLAMAAHLLRVVKLD